MIRPWPRWMLFIYLAVATNQSTAQAASWNAATLTGVMQQPTSHYYHLCYGLQLGVASQSGRLGATLQYIERPVFQAGGFSDKESAVIALATTKLTRAKNHGLYAGFGAGHLSGYIKADDKEAFSSANRTYAMYGTAAMVEYVYQWSVVEVAVNHQTLVGYVSDSQLKSMVAWPYNFYGIRLGYRW